MQMLCNKKLKNKLNRMHRKMMGNKIKIKNKINLFIDLTNSKSSNKKKKTNKKGMKIIK